MMAATHYKPEVLAILDRLQRGQDWLTQTHRKLLAMPDLGIGSDMEQRFLAGLDLFDDLDHKLRAEWGFRGCIQGQGQQCPSEAPVRCRGCMTQQGAFQL